MHWIRNVNDVYRRRVGDDGVMIGSRDITRLVVRKIERADQCRRIWMINVHHIEFAANEIGAIAYNAEITRTER